MTEQLTWLLNAVQFWLFGSLQRPVAVYETGLEERFCFGSLSLRPK
jgi:hypothetical protein